MESLSQEHDQQELLDWQLHDTLFGHINDIPSSERGTVPQEQTLFDDDLFFPGDDMMDDPPAAADESTRRMGFEIDTKYGICTVGISSTSLNDTDYTCWTGFITFAYSTYNPSFGDGFPPSTDCRPATYSMAMVLHRQKSLFTIQTNSSG
ncbi:hypothetical protein ZTR_06591 [Talaromyces verruculosus]|nr:hypothetical protein ZTR_06591 [Talaromyces verruculosus]